MMPFAPVDDATSSLAVSTTSNAAPLKRQPAGAHQIRLYNAGTATAFWAVGPSGLVATTADVPIPAGAIEVVTVNNPAAAPEAYIAAITASGTATLYVSTGSGF